METIDDAALAPLTLRLFSEFEGYVHSHPLPHLRTRKEKWLLALLTLAHGRPVSRVRLAQMLWPFPETLESASAHNLRRSLVEIRKALGPEATRLQSPTRETLSLDLTGADVDVVAFDAAFARGDEASLRQAVARYRGPLLIECTEDWVLTEREDRLNAYRQALNGLAARALDHDAPADAAHLLRRAIAVDPLWEPARRKLMAALRRCGDVPAALLVYRDFLRLLQRDDPRAWPSPETTALYQELQRETFQTSRQDILSRSASRKARRIPVPVHETGGSRGSLSRNPAGTGL